MLILRCVHLGELASSLPGAWLSVICLSCEAPAKSQVQGGTKRNNNSGGGQLSSSGVSSRGNCHSSQSAGTWMLWGRAKDLHSSGPAPAAGASLLPCVLLASACPGGSALSWAPAPRASRPALLESRSMVTQPPPGGDSTRAPSSCSQAPRGTRCSPLGSSAAGCGALSPGCRSSVGVPGSLLASPPS